MKKWLIRSYRAAMMGLAWAAAWVPVGALVGSAIVGELEPEWIGGPLYAGFLCGAMFSVVSGVAGGRRRVDEMSLAHSGVRGAASGFLMGALWLVVVLLSDPPQWLLEGAVVGSLTILSACSAVGSVLLTRIAKKGIGENLAL